MTGQLRALGLALQVLAGFILATAIGQLAQGLAFGREIVTYAAVNGAAAVVQLVAGCMLSYGSARSARWAAFAYALAELVSTIVLYQQTRMEGLWFVEHLLMLAWPFTVVAVAWGSGADHARRPAETGGVLLALGLTALLWAPIYSYAWHAMWSDLGRSLLYLSLSVGPRILIGLAAIYAGRQVIAGAAGSAVRTYLIVAIALALGFLLLEVVGVILEPDRLGRSIALSIVSAAATLTVPIVLWAYARPRGALVQRDMPDSASAAKALAWIVLWFAIMLGAYAIDLAFRGSASTAERVGLVPCLLLVAIDLAAFFSCHRGAARRTMWISAIGGVIALSPAVWVWLTFGDIRSQMLSAMAWMIAAHAAALFVLAWLHRPRAREQRGIDAVFD